MINSAYNYYLTNYVGKETSRYDTHKKSELRDVYNRMVKINKNSSLYKISESEEVKKYAIDLKEVARSITNIASELSENENLDSGFSKKKAISSDDDVISAKYIGNNDNEVNSGLKIKIQSIATNQVNTGHYLKQDAVGLKSGAYAFDFSIGEYTYEFQFNVKPNEDNRDIQDKLARLINRSNIGVEAEVVENSEGKSALSIQSEATGEINYKGTIFTISSNENSKSGDAVAHLGLDNIEKMPQNAKFTINGMERSSSSNTFTIAKQYMVNLKAASGDKEVYVGLKPDFDAILDNVNELIEKYNDMVDLAKDRVGRGYEAETLYRDIKGISSYYKDSLDSAGFKVGEDSKILVDEALFTQSANEGTLKDSLDKLGAFKKALLNKASNISLNPMAYVDKKLISYRNPVYNFNNVYMTSIYSGMMFNGYI